MARSFGSEEPRAALERDKMSARAAAAKVSVSEAVRADPERTRPPDLVGPALRAPPRGLLPRRRERQRVGRAGWSRGLLGAPRAGGGRGPRRGRQARRAAVPGRCIAAGVGAWLRLAAGGDAQQVRRRQTRRQEWVLPTLRARLRRAGGRGLGCHLQQAGSCRLWRSGWSPAKPCSFDLMSLSVVCAR